LRGPGFGPTIIKLGRPPSVFRIFCKGCCFKKACCCWVSWGCGVAVECFYGSYCVHIASIYMGVPTPSRSQLKAEPGEGLGGVTGWDFYCWS